MKILHIPRTGGTAIKATLVKGYKRHPKNVRYLPTRIKNLYICNHKQKLDGKDQYIVFVRDPIDRLISHFIFLKHKAQGYDTERYMNPSRDKVILKYDSVNDFAMDIFNLKLKKFIKISDILVSPKHIRKYQHNLIFVGRTEYLKKDFNFIQIAINPGIQIQLTNKYTNSRPEKYDYMTEINQEAKDNLRRYLDKDYEIIKCICDLGFLTKSYLKEINY